MILFGGNSTIYEIEDYNSDGGGQGSIYKVLSNPKLIAKVYNEKERTIEMEKKIKYMVSRQPSADFLENISWPLDILYDNNHNFLGFIMEKAQGVTFDTIANKDFRKEKYNLNANILYSINLCIASMNVHNQGYIIGDFNSGNIIINERVCKIKIIDTDSFVMTDDEGNKYECRAMKSGYIPPEIDKKKIVKDVTRESDLFLLAIHIFNILMVSHPFSGFDKDDHSSFDQQELIDSKIFPYNTKDASIITSYTTPKYDVLPPELQNLFNRAFIDGMSNPKNRPDEKEWINALEVFEKSNELEKCSKNHLYYDPYKTKKCPWCECLSFIKKNINPKTQTINNVTHNNVTQQRTYINLGGTSAISGGSGNKLNIISPRSIFVVAIVCSIAFYILGFTSTQKTNIPNSVKQETFEDVVNRSKKVDSNKTISGKMAKKDVIDEYCFIPDSTGYYQFNFDINDSSCKYIYAIVNSREEKLASEVVQEPISSSVLLKKDETYAIGIKQEDGSFNYNFEIIPSKVITSNTISGSIKYKKQKDYYTFEAPTTGKYRLDYDISDVNSTYKILVTGEKNETLLEHATIWSQFEGYKDGNNIDLEKGKRYNVIISHEKGFEDYNISIGIPNETKIVNNGTINGSLTFKGQIDAYSYTPPYTGTFEITLDSSNAHYSFDIQVFDHRNAKLYETNSSYWNTHKLNLEAGRTYIFKIIAHQNSYPLDYCVTITGR